MENMKSILVVCGGNTCRSSMAKIILGQMLKAKGLEKQFNLYSAAYNRADGPTAHPNSQQVIKELYGLDLLASHVPKKLTKTMVDETDLILVMEDYMKADLPPNKVIVLGIASPHGPDIQKYRKCAAEIQQSFLNNWSKIVGLAPSPQSSVSQQSATASKVGSTEFSKD